MPEDSYTHPRRFPKNADGPFYTVGFLTENSATPSPEKVWRGECFWCGAPESEAPALFAPFDDTYTDTYLIRQPSTPEEIEQVIRAAHSCCVYAVRYGGMDRGIISQLGNDPNLCDYISDENGSLRCTLDENGNFLPFANDVIAKQEAKSRARWIAFSRKHRNPVRTLLKMARKRCSQYGTARKKWWQFWKR